MCMQEQMRRRRWGLWLWPLNRWCPDWDRRGVEPRGAGVKKGEERTRRDKVEGCKGHRTLKSCSDTSTRHSTGIKCWRFSVHLEMKGTGWWNPHGVASSVLARCLILSGLSSIEKKVATDVEGSSVFFLFHLLWSSAGKAGAFRFWKLKDRCIK